MVHSFWRFDHPATPVMADEATMPWLAQLFGTGHGKIVHKQFMLEQASDWISIE